MPNSKLHLIQQVAPIKETIYLSKESSPPEKNLVYSIGKVSIAEHGKKMMSLYSGHQSQAGMVNIREIRPETFFGMPRVSFDIGGWFPPKNLTVSDVLPLMRPKPILSEETDEIIIVPLREIPYEYAKLEISKYIQSAGCRKVYISELAEVLRLDIELIMDIMEELGAD